MGSYDPLRDPVLNVVYGQIVRAIDVLYKEDCWLESVKLVYSGIDTMAYLGMPSDKEDVTREDFVRWCDGYVRFPCRNQLTGLDLYGARCAVLHQHGAHSRLSRDGKCRLVGYMNYAEPEVQNHAKHPDLVLVSVYALAKAFKEGVNKYLPELFSDPERREAALKRFEGMHHKIPVEELGKANAPTAS